ncbi:MAG: lysine--tRNA ligase [Candidatus Moraniibacteriota bacterium]|nr:MAG: lysine--tRNA ligase [Candidatus Moranbacteria bacterium]
MTASPKFSPSASIKSALAERYGSSGIFLPAGVEFDRVGAVFIRLIVSEIMREDIVFARREKLDRVTSEVGDAFPEESHRTHTNVEALSDFESLAEKEIQVSLVGRVRSLRSMGKIAFAHIEDESGKMQIFIRRGALSNELFSLFVDGVDVGDFIEATGTLFTTKQNEKTLAVSTWRMLSKSLRPMPSEFYGLKDEEELLRRRYLDLAMNPETRELFRKKSIFWQTIRNFLAEENFLEVQTPVLEHVPGGAEAEPFVTHHNALDQDFYLRISLELPLKRLLVGGYERVFEIGRVFRNEGIDREHLQEFDHMEFYAAYADMKTGMELVEQLYRLIVERVTGNVKTVWNDETIDWQKPFERVDYFTAFKKETGIDLSEDITIETLKRKSDELGIKYESSYGKGRMIDTIYKKTVRKKLIQPCFLVGHPIEVSPLAKRDPKSPNKTLRFQPIACASELGNGFAELNDPIDQRSRFEEQMKLRESGDVEAQQLDEDFLEALEYGMPPACGFGMSERFFAILMNRSVRETVIFPPMRDKELDKKQGKKTLQIAVAIINTGIGLKPWQELNTIAHLNAAFGARIGKSLFFQDEITTEDNQKIKLNIQHAIIIKTVPSNNVMQLLVRNAKEQHVEVSEFTAEMLETTNDKKVIDLTQKKELKDVQYLGALLFGEKELVEKLTQGFDLHE